MSNAGGRTAPATMSIRRSKKYWSCGDCAGAVGEYGRRLPGAASATGTLGVVSGRRRDIAKVDSIQGRNVDPKFHRRRAKECRKELTGLPALLYIRFTFGNPGPVVVFKTKTPFPPFPLHRVTCAVCSRLSIPKSELPVSESSSAMRV